MIGFKGRGRAILKGACSVECRGDSRQEGMGPLCCELIHWSAGELQDRWGWVHYAVSLFIRLRGSLTTDGGGAHILLGWEPVLTILWSFEQTIYQPINVFPTRIGVQCAAPPHMISKGCMTARTYSSSQRGDFVGTLLWL